MRPGVDSTRRDNRLAFGIHRLVARLDLGMQGDRLGEQRVLDLANVVERHALARFLRPFLLR